MHIWNKNYTLSDVVFDSDVFAVIVTVISHINYIWVMYWRESEKRPDRWENRATNQPNPNSGERKQKPSKHNKKNNIEINTKIYCVRFSKCETRTLENTKFRSVAYFTIDIVVGVSFVHMMSYAKCDTIQLLLPFFFN